MDSTSLTYARIARWRTFWQHRLPLIATHPVPRTHWTVYGLDGQARFCIWKQWGRRCYQVLDFPLPEGHGYFE